MINLALIKATAADVRRLARKQPYAPRDLNGWCLWCSSRLFLLLRRWYPTSTYLCGNHDHAFVHCGGLLVDITATQFGRWKELELRVQGSPSTRQWFWEPKQRYQDLASATRFFREFQYSDDFDRLAVAENQALLVTLEMRDLRLRADTTSKSKGRRLHA